MSDRYHKAAQAMEAHAKGLRNGGGFSNYMADAYTGLAQAYYTADHSNRAKLLQEFAAAFKKFMPPEQCVFKFEIVAQVHGGRTTDVWEARFAFVLEDSLKVCIPPWVVETYQGEPSKDATDVIYTYYGRIANQMCEAFNAKVGA